MGDAQVSLDRLRGEDSLDFVEALSTQGFISFSVSWEADVGGSKLDESGTLVVELVRATNLLSADRNGFSDPYVKLSLAGKTHKSKTIRKTLNPTWNETFGFTGSLRDMTAQPLELKAFDYDFGKRDDKLGNASIDLSELRRLSEDARAMAQEWQIEDSWRLSTQGEVYLRFAWKPEGKPHQELQARAVEFVEREAQRINQALDNLKVADDLRNFEYISLGMMLKLAENEVLSLDDLADLDSDELVALLSEHGLEDDTEAGDIIMAARAHWFDDEPEVGEASDAAEGDAATEAAPEAVSEAAGGDEPAAS